MFFKGFVVIACDQNFVAMRLSLKPLGKCLKRLGTARSEAVAAVNEYVALRQRRDRRVQAVRT